MPLPHSPHRRRALRLLGLPVLGLLPAAPFIRHARAADVPRFALGVASGLPQPDTLVLWTRLTGPDLPDTVPVRWELATDERFDHLVAHGETMARADEAHSLHIEPRGLEPGRGYHYRFIALVQQSAHGRTRTAPAPDQNTTLHLALASCQRLDHGRWAAWRHVAEQNPDLVLFAGDYIYEYAISAHATGGMPQGVTHTLDQYRDRYALYKADPALQAAHAAAPWVLVWDDHEVENDYAGAVGGGGGGTEFLARRAAAYRAWWEHQPVPQSWKPEGPAMAIHGRLHWGRLATLLRIDDRQYRDLQACPRRAGRAGSNVVDWPDCATLGDPSRSLLGGDQERWLAGAWDRDRPWNLLLQQTLMARLNRDPAAVPGEGRVWTDGWDGYPAARQRLLQGAVAGGARNLVVLGGDVHAHMAADLRVDPDRADGPIVASEFCSTSISSRGPMQAGLDVARLINPHLRHARGDERGWVSLRLDAQAAEARLMAVDRAWDPDSGVHEQARFIVEADRPGIQRA